MQHCPIVLFRNKPHSDPTEPFSFLGSPVRNLTFGVTFVLVVMLLATIAYWLLGWPLGDAFYMVILTVYTVGYDEVRPVDTALLRTVTISTIVLGCTGMIFLTGALVQFITLNQLNEIFGQRRMTTQIDRLNRHAIICGFGRLGMALALELRDGGVRFVLVDCDAAVLEAARHLGFLTVLGDAADAAVLEEAGAMRARTLATVLPSDAANVFITLRARAIRPDLEIIARAEQSDTEPMLLQAGASKVVLPTHISAERIAEMIRFPEGERLDHASQRVRHFEQVLASYGLEMEMIEAIRGGRLAGQTVGTVERIAGDGVFVVRVNRLRGLPVVAPEPDTMIEPGDAVVLLGRGAKARGLGRTQDT